MLISKLIYPQMKLYSNITAIFIIWAISVLTIFFFGFSNFPHSDKFNNNFWENLANWDGGHYLGIAQFGYREKYQYAFFPLYPLLIKALNNLTQNYLMSSLLISIISSFLAIHLLFSLIRLDFDKQSLPSKDGKKIAEKVVLILLMFPTSFYFLTAYSEGLFLLLSLATFLFLRKGNLLLAVVAAALASATRVMGVALVLALIIEVWTKRGINKSNWYVLLAPGGLIIYCWYLFNQTGDPFYFITAQLHWQRVLTPPPLSFWETLRSLVTPGFITQNFNAFLDLLFTIFGLGLILRAFRFLPLTYAVYGLISVLLPLATSSLSSIPRFLLPIFPIFILIAAVKKQYVFFAYQIISLMLLGAFAILFINGYWVS